LTLNFYSEGHEMHAVKDDYDPNQMGGDFVIDAAGVVRLAYYSATNTDRPTPTAHTDRSGDGAGRRRGDLQHRLDAHTCDTHFVF
jgi:hypothetical protein